MKRVVSIILVIFLLATTGGPVSAQVLDPGSAVTNFTVQNLSLTEVAQVQAQYIGTDGSVVATVPASGSAQPYIEIQPKSSAGFPASESGLPSGFEGSAIVSGNQELAAFAQMLWSGGTSSDGKTLAAYNAFRQGATKLYFPSLFARSGKQYSVLTIQSAESASTTETVSFNITFYNRNGAVAKTLTNQTVNKGAQKSYNLLDQGLPVTNPPGDGWIGSAVVESSSPLAGVAITHWTEYSAAYSAVTSGGTKAYLPSATRRLSGSDFIQYTGINVQNLDPSDAANIRVTWYDRTGNQLHQFTDSIPANSAKGYNTQFNADTPNPSALFSALGTDWNGSVVIESTNGKNIVAIANLQWTAISGPGNSASSYYSESSGNDQIFVPATFRRVSGSTWNQYTGLIVQNIGSSACNNFSVEWRDRDGNLLLNYTDSLPANIAHGYNTRVASDLTNLGQDPANLGNDFRGSVFFNAPGCELVAIHNTLFPAWTDSSTYNAFGQ